MDNIIFKVGRIYENMKGLYEVLSINGETMIIQWENGEKTVTTKKLQARIIQRMQDEREFVSKESKRTGRVKISTIGKRFAGLKEMDFKDNVVDTHWRCRESLGGAVTTGLPYDKFKFNSHSVYRMPEILWMDENHKGTREEKWHLGKFFAQVDQQHLYYGFYIEKPTNLSITPCDWKKFFEWFKISSNQDWLKEQLAKCGLVMKDKYSQCFKGEIIVQDGKFIQRNEDKTEREIKSAAEFIEGLPEDKWLDLQISRIVPKDEAVKAGIGIAYDISKLFSQLMPMYAEISG